MKERSKKNWLVAGCLMVYFTYRILSYKTISTPVQLMMTESFNDSLTTARFSVVENQNLSLADQLAKRVRVLCWVLTTPGHHETRAKHIKATWGRRCNVLLFMSSTEDKQLPSVQLHIVENRLYLWGKTKAAFKYVYNHHRDDADWFLKADDDTYVIVENLRYLLAEHDSKSYIYFGCRFKNIMKEGYMSGGAGYVLSRGALDRLVEEGFLKYNGTCNSHITGSEDVEIALCKPKAGNILSDAADRTWPRDATYRHLEYECKCLAKVGVKAMDSRDFMRRGRFFPFKPIQHIEPGADNGYWYWDYAYYPFGRGLDCCSEHAISFHYIKPIHLYVLEYLIYNKPYGIVYVSNERTKEKHFDEIVKDMSPIYVPLRISSRISGRRHRFDTLFPRV